jgi:hypothetical protein
MFVNSETAAILRDPGKMLIAAYTTGGRSIDERDLEREIRSSPGRRSAGPPRAPSTPPHLARNGSTAAPAS